MMWMVSTVIIHYPLAPSTGCASCFVTGKKKPSS